jgi:cytoskeletal protein RodZ
MHREQPAGEFGKSLRVAREQHGMSLRAISDATRISMRALEALERDEISRLPGGIFSRAFVRAYAVEVGLNPDATVDDFVRQFPHESVVVGHRTAARHDNAPPRDYRRTVMAIGLAFALVIVALMVYRGVAAHRSTSTVRTPGQQLVAPKASAR